MAIRHPPDMTRLDGVAPASNRDFLAALFASEVVRWRARRDSHFAKKPLKT
jgi:hypothetical protein